MARFNEVYEFRKRFGRGGAFTVLREEYAGRGVTVDGIRQQVKNAAQRFAPGRRCRIRVTEQGDLVVRVEDRTRPSAPRGVGHAPRAA